MYPDTDLPPKKIDKERLDKIKFWIPQQFWIRQKWYNELGIPPDTIEELSISKYAELFKKAVNEWKVNPTTAAVFLIQYPKRLKKEGHAVELLSEEIFTNVLKNHSEGKILRDALLPVLRNVLELGVFIEEVILPPINEKELDEAIIKAKNDLSSIVMNREENYSKILMGMLMKNLRGKIGADVVAERIGFRKEVRSNGK
jgi:glutamyl-tRNA(Gln) amidotransferase subunit E